MSSSFNPRGKFRFDTNLGTYGAAHKEHKLMDTIFFYTVPLPFNGLLISPRKRVYTLIWSPGFCDCFPGDISRSLGSGSQWGLHL